MKIEDVKIGMKVVPNRKSLCGKLENSNVWKRAENMNQSFLYVKIIKDNNCIVLSETAENYLNGDFFHTSDFEPYVIPYISQFNIGDQILINNKPNHWCSEFSLNYPVKGYVKDIKNINVYVPITVLLVEIDGKIYEFEEESLLKVCKMINKKDQEELKITRTKVIEAANKCSAGKEILKTLFPEAFETEFKYDPDKIYIFKNNATSKLYKLYQVNCVDFKLIDINNSYNSYNCNSFRKENIFDLMKSVGKFYIFNTEKEFIKWRYDYLFSINDFNNLLY